MGVDVDEEEAEEGDAVEDVVEVGEGEGVEVVEEVEEEDNK